MCVCVLARVSSSPSSPNWRVEPLFSVSLMQTMVSIRVYIIEGGADEDDHLQDESGIFFIQSPLTI